MSDGSLLVMPRWATCCALQGAVCSMEGCGIGLEPYADAQATLIMSLADSGRGCSFHVAPPS